MIKDIIAFIIIIILSGILWVYFTVRFAIKKEVNKDE